MECKEEKPLPERNMLRVLLSRDVNSKHPEKWEHAGWLFVRCMREKDTRSGL